MIGPLLTRALPALVILVLWELGAIYLFEPRFIGQPSRILAYFAGEVVKPGIWRDAQITFGEILAGYAIGVATGGALGFWLGFRPRLARVVEPYLLVLSAIPKLAIAPIIIIALGIGMQSKIFIVVSMVFFLMFYAVFSAVKQIEPDFIHQAQIMNANRLEVIRYVVAPAISPSIFDGMKTSIVFAMVGALLGEFIASKAGLGFYIMNASGAFNVNGIWSGVIMIVGLIGVLTTLIGVAERRMLRWLPDHGSGPVGL
jgi:NitT/TauT family transport system permease protein